MRTLLFLLLLLAVAVPVSMAQTVPVKGVVWVPPENPARATQDLLLMDRLGVEAVRTPLIEDARLLQLGDRLGLQFYQELPVAYLPARALRDTLQWAAEKLRRALARAQGHPSARHFGLARFSDTSTPLACAYFEELASLAPQSTRTYYVTAFVEDDRCAGTVDLVLVDARDMEAPEHLLARWREAWPETSAGYAAVGTWTHRASGGSPSGPHAPAAQARHLEETLRQALGSSSRDADAAPAAVFIYRWRTGSDSMQASSYPGRSYGLVDDRGQPRPALDVLKGFYTGRQRVFALASGSEPMASAPWLTLLAWGVVALLAGSYAGSPRLRRMVPRYFGSRGFYREAIQEGRDIMSVISILLLVSVSLSAGIIVAVFAQFMQDSMAFQVLLGGRTRGAADTLLALLETPWLVVLTVAGIHSILVALWSLMLAMLSRRNFRLNLTQCLALVTWPRWTYYLLTVATLVLATFPPPTASTGMLVVGVLWVVCTLYAVGRTLYDFARITKVPTALACAAALLSPVLWLLIVAFVAVLQNPGDVAFLWHLVTRN